MATTAARAGGDAEHRVITLHRAARVVLAGFSTIGMACGGELQPSASTLADQLSCSGCTIELIPVAALGTIEGPGAIGDIPRDVQVDGLGRYWVVGRDLVVFGENGTVISVIGRSGSGPGEFQSFAAVVPLPGDSMLIIDANALRGTVLDAGLAAARMISLPARPAPLESAVALDWPDTVMLAASMQDRSSIMWPLHSLSLRGGIADHLRSFGREQKPMQRMLIARPASNTVWTSDVLDYRLTAWRDGIAVDSIERRPPWFSSRSTRPYGTPSEPPTPSVRALEVDAEGLIWAFIHVAAPDWKSAWAEELPANVTEIRPGDVDDEKLFHTMVEVIDPVARRVIVRQTIPHFTVAALPRRRVALYITNDDGYPAVVILSLRVAGR